MNEYINNDFKNYDEIIKMLELNFKLDDDIIYLIFKKINQLLNGPSCFSGDKGKLFNIINLLFEEKIIGSNHLTALTYPNYGSYYYYHIDDIIKIFKLFLEKGIIPNENHISSYTNPKIIIFLYNENIDLIDLYIRLLIKKNKKRFLEEIIEFLAFKNELINRKKMINGISESKTVNTLLDKYLV